MRRASRRRLRSQERLRSVSGASRAARRRDRPGRAKSSLGHAESISSRRKSDDRSAGRREVTLEATSLESRRSAVGVAIAPRSMRGRTFRFKSPPLEAIVPGTRVALGDSKKPRNRRGSPSACLPEARARVDARTPRLRKRAVARSSEGLTHEASIPETFCGSRRSLARAREWHATLGTCQRRWRNRLRPVAKPSAPTTVEETVEDLETVVGTWQGREDSSIDPQKERISELKPIVINSIQSIQFPSASTFAKPHTRAELKRRKIAVLSESDGRAVSELMSRSRRHETRGAGIGGVDRRSRSCGATGVGSGARTSVAGVATASGARSPADCAGNNTTLFPSKTGIA